LSGAIALSIILLEKIASDLCKAANHNGSGAHVYPPAISDLTQNPMLKRKVAVNDHEPFARLEVEC